MTVARATRSREALLALDAATRAIAGELDLDRVLQLMVDSVRGLIGSHYAALGIVEPRGRIERFITSGISAEVRAEIGPPPQGHGLLGTIIRDGISLRVRDIGAHAESYGFPAHHPPMHSLLGVPVTVGGTTIGNFYLTEKIGAEEFDEADQELVEMFAVHAGIAIQNARLHRQVRQLAVVDERLRISRDLHDGIIQSIYAVGLSLEDVPELMSEDPDEAARRVDRAIDRLNLTIGDIRTFITRLAGTGDASLGAAIVDLVAELTQDAPVTVRLDIDDAAEADARLSTAAAHEVIQIVREALSNVVRHAKATEATITLVADETGLTLVVTDDGKGFDASGGRATGHMGLVNLAERAIAAGGELAIESEPGRGTRIIVRIPMPEPEPAQP